MLTDFRFGYFRYRLNVNAQDYGQIPAVEQPEIAAEIPNISAVSTGNPFATGLPDFQIPGLPASNNDYLRLGYSGVANSCNCPLREREQQFQLVNNWTRSSGKHLIKWGTDIRFFAELPLVQRPAARLGFSILGLGRLRTRVRHNRVGVGDFSHRRCHFRFERTTASAAAVKAGEHQKRISFYGQDTWRINSRLVVNYGLRWEIYFPQTVTDAGGFLIPDFSNRDPATTYFRRPRNEQRGIRSRNLTRHRSEAWHGLSSQFELRSSEPDMVASLRCGLRGLTSSVLRPLTIRPWRRNKTSGPEASIWWQVHRHSPFPVAHVFLCWILRQRMLGILTCPRQPSLLAELYFTLCLLGSASPRLTLGM